MTVKAVVVATPQVLEEDPILHLRSIASAVEKKLSGYPQASVKAEIWPSRLEPPFRHCQPAQLTVTVENLPQVLVQSHVGRAVRSQRKIASSYCSLEFTFISSDDRQEVVQR